MIFHTAVPMEIDGDDDAMPMELDPTQSPARPMDVDSSPARPAPMLISPQVNRTEPRRHLPVERSTIRNLMDRFEVMSRQAKHGRIESSESLLADEKKPEATTVPAQKENVQPNIAPNLRKPPSRQRKNAITPDEMAAAIALLNTAQNNSQATPPRKQRKQRK